jgi:hypothetical protein
MPAGRFGFGEPLLCIGLGIEKLALEVGLFDVIAIDQANNSGSGARQERGLNGSQRPAADNRRSRPAEVFLSLRTEWSEADLTAESFLF